MIGEGTALLETELGFPIPLLVSFSLFIYHSPLHHRMRFHPCTGRLESYRPVTSAPTLYSNPYSHKTLGPCGHLPQAVHRNNSHTRSQEKFTQTGHRGTRTNQPQTIPSAHSGTPHSAPMAMGPT